ncbi:MAG TPA: 3-hydroxyacyl-CoA dehydrogenase NAD-binding domain-containing protein [Nitrolancea sp.]|nr:3-hydroxyacyl-CoA dehydrogenase NAD-binding domain-containing protein [Nitrolancea sp.]
MRIRKVGVVGAGTMGAAIAGLVASAGLPTVLLDMPGPSDRNGPAKQGLDRAVKARPAAFMDPARAALIELGNIEDDLEKLKSCDWVVEAIIEKLEPKKALFARLDGLLDPTTIVTTNTSGIPIHTLSEGRSEAFRSRFLGTHFFNPPRYLHLLELIPTPDTDPTVLDTIETFGRVILGKGTVQARDVPGFIANRLGVYAMIRAIGLMQDLDLTIDEVDALTGPLIGRPRSATFRTADLTGIDVLLHVAAGLSQTTGENFDLPDWVAHLAAENRLGEKTGAGFYRREGGQILTLNVESLAYEPRAELRLPEIGVFKDKPLEQRLNAVFKLPGKYGEFMRRLFAQTAHYTLEHAPQLAYDIADIDRAMEWGFGWELGPFKQFDAIGHDVVSNLLRDSGLAIPEELVACGEAFFRQGEATTEIRSFTGGYRPVRPIPDALSLRDLRTSGKVLKSSSDATLFDLGDGVALVEFHTKMNAIGDGVLRMIRDGLAWVEDHGFVGLVIGNEHQQAFSAGANVAMMLSFAQEDAWDDLDMMIRQFQRSVASLRYAPFPIVVAASGLALGGGAEIVMHADRVQAGTELYIGLVEAGVGLIPAGGGTKELLFRFTNDLAPYVEADPFEALRRAFTQIAMAQTSISALDARNLGFLRAQDSISMNRDLLLADAKRAVLALAPGYVAPTPARIQALGSEALGNLRYAVWSMREASQITDHEVLIGNELAFVLCGGDGPPHNVTEQEILDLEREAFLRLLGTRKSQERMAHMLKTGKALRN